jgi:hypothetical protein
LGSRIFGRTDINAEYRPRVFVVFLKRLVTRSARGDGNEIWRIGPRK